MYRYHCQYHWLRHFDGYLLAHDNSTFEKNCDGENLTSQRLIWITHQHQVMQNIWRWYLAHVIHESNAKQFYWLRCGFQVHPVDEPLVRSCTSVAEYVIYEKKCKIETLPCGYLEIKNGPMHLPTSYLGKCSSCNCEFQNQNYHQTKNATSQFQPKSQWQFFTCNKIQQHLIALCLYIHCGGHILSSGCCGCVATVWLIQLPHWNKRAR